MDPRACFYSQEDREEDTRVFQPSETVVAKKKQETDLDQLPKEELQKVRDLIDEILSERNAS